MVSPALAREFLSRVSAPRRARPGCALRDVRQAGCPRFRARSRARVAEARHRACATGPDPPKASSADAATTASAREESARIQRDLANRLLDAQTGWVSVPKKKTKSEPDAFSDAPSVSDALSNLGPRSLSIGTEGEAVPLTRRSTDDDTDNNDNSSSFLTLSDGGTVLDEAWKRGTWLLGLLVAQSSSSVVLERYADLVKDHIEITLFLTMLVGAGGNAGNQSAISVIRGLATGTIQPTFSCALGTMWRQTRVGVALASVLSAGGFIRVLASRAAFADAGDVGTLAAAGTDPALVAAIGIATSLFAIVTASTLTGSALPFALAAAGQDPANAGTTIQVCMDVAGVVITCVVCSFVFEYFGGVAELGSTVVGVATGLS
jgi:hypothetical protein